MKKGDKKILGQVIFRKTGTIVNGKEAVIITGIVALSEEEQQRLKGEHQYIITGCDIYPAYERDLTETLKGSTLDNALHLPIWKL